MIQHKFSILLLFIAFSLQPVLPLKEWKAVKKEQIQWMTIEKAMELNKTHPRKIYIDFYTDWCGWCKKMDHDTYTDSKVISEMNNAYYAVKFNAESKDPVHINQTEYRYSPTQNINGFTLSLLDGQIGYPTAVILDERSKKITAVPGYQEPAMLVEILSYFGHNNHLKESFEDFQKKAAK